MNGEVTQILLVVIATVILLSAGIEDARTREIANRKSVALVLLAPLWWWANGASAFPGAAIQLGVAAALFALFALAFHLRMMGGGDVKLIGALALWLPPAPLLTMLTLMALAGGAVTLAMVAEHGWRRHRARRSGGKAPGDVEVPYGVAIAVAGMLVLHEPVLNQFG